MDPINKLASSLSRIWMHVKQNPVPIGIITAFRQRYKKSENLKRNAVLAGQLRSAGFGFIRMEGHYVEGFGGDNPKDAFEHVFFVIGQPDESRYEEHEEEPGYDNLFKDKLIRLGYYWYQDSILFKPSYDEHAYLIGTRERNEDGEKVWPGMNKVVKAGIFHPQQVGEFYSKMRKNTFMFTSQLNEPGGLFGRWAYRLIAEGAGILSIDDIKKER